MLEKCLSTCLLLCILVLELVASDAKLRLYYVTSSKIWDDSGSGADEDVSLWRPEHVPTGFYPVGDIAIQGHNANPSYTNPIVAQEIESGALAEPKSLTQVWNDQGSRADNDVAIYRMDPPNGYTCLGNIAINTYHSLPDKSKYRCVKDDYLVTGSLAFVWTDEGSGADRDVGLWRVEGRSGGFGPHTFLSYPYYHRPSGQPGKAFASNHVVWKQS